MFMIETHRSVVQAEDCDSNGHLNVSEYVELFSQAGQNLFAANGFAAQIYCPVDRHLRFHSEIRSNTCLRMNSIVVGRGTHAGFLFHTLWDEDNNRLSATCLDAPFCDACARLPNSIAGAPINALPRGIVQARFPTIDAAGMVKERLALKTYRGRFDSQNCDSRGEYRQGPLVEKFFKSASHLWRHIGLRPDWFVENNVGAIALEMKLTVHGNAPAGQDFEVVSWVPAITDKTALLSHQLSAVPDGKPIASISALAALMDLKTRTVIDLPKSVADRFQARFSEIQKLALY